MLGEHEAANGETTVTHVPESWKQALSYMKKPGFIKSGRFRAQLWHAKREGMNEGVLRFADRMMKRAILLGIPLYAGTMFVPEYVQARLYVTGESMQGPGESPFNHGEAVELLHGVYGRDMPWTCWQLLNELAESCMVTEGVELVWGHDEAPWLWRLPNTGDADPRGSVGFGDTSKAYAALAEKDEEPDQAPPAPGRAALAVLRAAKRRKKLGLGE